MTSHDVVQRVRRLSGERRAGHAGTLDPAAEGVLLICLGKATRVVEYLMGAPKRYCAQITLGTVTDTGDADGQVIYQSPAISFSRTEVESAVLSFRGRIRQIPPMYSAIKRNGQRLYHLARKGQEVVREAREVEIYHIRLLDWQPPVATVDLLCSKGTYVRTLATDLGEKLGCGGFLSKLVRLASGGFVLDDAVRLAELADAFDRGTAEALLYPLDEALLGYPAAILSSESERMIRNGLGVPLGIESGVGSSTSGLCRAYGSEGNIVALLFFDAEAGLWRPRKVF